MDRTDFWIAVSDLHESSQRIEDIPEVDRAAGIIITGDLTNAGDSRKADPLLDRIARINPVIYALMGNMDRSGVETLLQGRNMSIHARGVRLRDNIGLAGVGCSLPTPFGTPSEVSEATLAAWLEQAVGDVRHLQSIILATHNPPWATIVDRLRSGKHVGSRKLREFIEQHQPDVVVTGHIHEAVGEERIGASKIVNPGPLRNGGYALIRPIGEGRLDAELHRIPG